ncbi:MAG TPA: DedA family protein [Bacteroidia bacterium]|nr:DedA family protein [Bacteroidia bacterium]
MLLEKLSELPFYIKTYGYIVIFLCVFLQELGIPNPITNELVLIFCGYLCYTGILSLYKVIIVAILADFIGTSILYFVFYFFSKWIISTYPSLIPVKGKTIDRLKNHILKGGFWSIYIGRLTPFLRGYVSVAAGIMQIERVKFLSTVIISAITWSGGLVLLGWILGPYWKVTMQKDNIIESILLVVALMFVILFIVNYLKRRQLKNVEF